MDPIKNPYAPGAGTPPPELAGRQEIIDFAQTTIQRVIHGRPAQSLILVGLRGVGKTVLLNKIAEISREVGAISVQVEAHEGKSLAELIVPRLRSLLYELSRVEAAKENARRGLRILKAFINSVKVKIGEIEFGIGIDAEEGVADSGDLEADLPELFEVIAGAAKSGKLSIVLLIDELQYQSTKEFSALIMSMHRINQKGLPLIMVGAGLPQILGLAGNSKSYAERLFRYPEIGALEEPDARLALINPALSAGASFEEGAISDILKITERYPYFLQQWAYEAWNTAKGPVIGRVDVANATHRAISELDRSFFKVRFDRCTPSEKRYMRALAQLGAGKHRSGDIAELLGVKTNSVAPTRSALIKKGMIYSPAHGDTAFTVPMFDQYMRRVMPELHG